MNSLEPFKMHQCTRLINSPKTLTRTCFLNVSDYQLFSSEIGFMQKMIINFTESYYEDFTQYQINSSTQSKTILKNMNIRSYVLSLYKESNL
ncbi:unnamed protein product [Pocillopora meandrina]|uniref:Uncharacterized protein n=1 Tax=Pocillopora meandrina TaxID=46732 RepID=A0AAU9W4W9_9CNID|nr:unnamed protein product [Pocillopora meandrina]